MTTYLVTMYNERGLYIGSKVVDADDEAGAISIYIELENPIIYPYDYFDVKECND